MIPNPDKYEDLSIDQKEHFARMGFKIYHNIISNLRMSGEADKLCQTVCKAQDEIFRAMQETVVKANNTLTELKHKAK